MTGGPALSFYETLVTSQVDGPALGTFTTAVSMLPGAAHYALPAGFFSQIGKSVRIKAKGRISTFTSGTFTFSVQMGPTSNISVFSPAAVTMIASQTNLTWELAIDLVARAIGSGTGANLMGIGKFVTAAVTNGNVMLPASAPAVGTGFDSTVVNVVDLFAACSVSNAANAITCHQYSLESLN